MPERKVSERRASSAGAGGPSENERRTDAVVHAAKCGAETWRAAVKVWRVRARAAVAARLISAPLFGRGSEEQRLNPALFCDR